MLLNAKQLLKKTCVIRPFSTKELADRSSLDYCASIVRQHDYENFLASLLLTQAIRSPALVIRAFNVEVARIQDQTSDPHTAGFRLQFWYDTLNSIYQKRQEEVEPGTTPNIPANPVSQELFKVCKCYNLPKRHLEKLITSRREILKTRFFNTLADIEKYAEESVSSIYYLLLGVAGVKDIHADHAASHLGKAQGLANSLRSIYVSNQHKMVTLPMDLLMQHKLSQETVLRSTESDNLNNVVFEVASRANSHLEKAKKIKVPKTANQIFLPGVVVDSYLKKLQAVNFNVFDKRLQKPTPMLPFKLYYNRLANKF